MKTRPWFDTAPVAILSRAAACALMFCSRCLQHKVSVVDVYRIDEKSPAAACVPIIAFFVWLCERYR
jgi:hypothetical protein